MSSCSSTRALIGDTVNSNQQLTQMKSNVSFLREGKTGVPGENLSVQRREPTNSSRIWRRVWESNPGHIDGRRVVPPLCHPCEHCGLVWILRATSLLVLKHCSIIKWSCDLRSYERNFCNCVKKPEKFRTSTGFEPVINFTYNFIVDSFLAGTLEPTNDQLPTSVAS